MVKSIIIDEAANQILNDILTENSKISKTGLLIGSVKQMTIDLYNKNALYLNYFKPTIKIDHSKDYIIHVVSTPPNENSISASSKSSDKKDDVDSNWIIDHALQV